MNEDYFNNITSIDQSNISEITNKYWKDIWNYAYLITKDHEQSNDIAQDVFVKAFRSLHTYRGEASVKTWLLKITRNTAYSHQRSAFFRKIILFDVVRSRENELSAEKQYFNKKLVNEIWEFVMNLPKHHREVIVLDAHYEMSIEEISNLLGIAKGTVKSRLHRARRILAKKIKEEENYVGE
ncbi:RNA polymerase sigma factor [Paenibacillus sp. MBLB4367]|uniref:RNA polymerase sigma factor n=1 Tax=Paenibacillus sp. MBLB4367 TaxID=3384767 RepID=UPI0039081480